MKSELALKNRLKEARAAAGLSQAQLAAMVGVSRNTISSIETGQFNPTAKLALILCIDHQLDRDGAVQPHRQAGPHPLHRAGQKIRGAVLF